jgi:hypothetical protein
VKPHLRVVQDTLRVHFARRRVGHGRVDGRDDALPRTDIARRTVVRLARDAHVHVLVSTLDHVQRGVVPVNRAEVHSCPAPLEAAVEPPPRLVRAEASGTRAQTADDVSSLGDVWCDQRVGLHKWTG